MKKQLLLIYLLFITITVSAQNNWKACYPHTYSNLSTHGNYTWAIDGGNVYKINNSDGSFVELLDTIKNYGVKRGLTSRNDQAWFCFNYKNKGFYIRHYKSDNSFDEIKPADVNETNIYSLETDITTTNFDASNAYFLCYNIGTLLYFRDNSFKKISLINKQYNIIKYIDDNTLLLGNSSDNIFQLIDTNGITKKYISESQLGISDTLNNYIIDIDVDETKNIYFAVKNIGIYKMNCNLPNEPVTLFIPFPNFGLPTDGHKEVKYTADGNILILNGTIASIYTINGTSLYNIPNLQSQFSFYYGKFMNINNKHELITTTGKSLIKYSNNVWVDLYEKRNDYDPEELVLNAAFGKNGVNIIGDNRNIFHQTRSNIKYSNLNDPTPLVKTYFAACTVDNNGKIWYYKKAKLYELFDNDTDIEHIDFPNPTNFANTISVNIMSVSSTNEVQFLCKTKILSYNQNLSSWDTYTLPTNSTIIDLFSIANDQNNNTWVGTDKGIALVENKSIVLNATINETRPIDCIRYIKSINSLVYTLKNINTEFIIYNLSTNTKTSYTLPSAFQAELNSTVLCIDKNDNIWMNTFYSGVHRFNIQSLTFDLNFNKDNSIMNTNGFRFISVDEENNKYFFPRESRLCYIYNENSIALNSNDNIVKNNTTNITLYPNPTSGIITIDSKEIFQSYSVYNMLGEVLGNGKIENRKIDLSELPNGVYTVKVIGERGESFRKVIKN